jgi:hypothetical protein
MATMNLKSKLALHIPVLEKKTDRRKKSERNKEAVHKQV